MGEKYYLTYCIEARPDGITAEQIQEAEGDLGGCDAVVLCSILYPEEGGCSVLAVSLDGRTGEPLSTLEVFKVWGMLAHTLIDAGLPLWADTIVRAAFGSIQRFVLDGRAG